MGTHNYPPRYDARTRREGLNALPGYRIAKLGVPLVPSPEETRAALIDARRRHGLARGHMAYLLRTSTWQIEKWERGTRKPTGQARYLIQIIIGQLDQQAAKADRLRKKREARAARQQNRGCDGEVSGDLQPSG